MRRLRVGDAGPRMPSMFAHLDVDDSVALLAATFARMISRVKLFVSQLFAGNCSLFCSRLAFSSIVRASSRRRSVV
jgi:hypothetical protein